MSAVVSAITDGVDLIDTSPFYGQGLSEHRVGTALRRADRRPVLSTKVARYADPFRPPASSTFAGGLPHEMVLDYSYDGAMRSLEQSLIRLGTDRIDIALVHDLDFWTHGEKLEGHYREAMKGAVKALASLRDAGTIAAYGVGVNEADMAERFVRDTDADVVLLAGRYSLLEQPAADSFLPLAAERNIGVILGGVFNSGILATGPIEGARYDYKPAPPEILERVRRIETVCSRHSVALRRAALQFVLRHPAVACVVLGAISPEETRAQAADLSAAIPASLWEELKTEGLLDESIPT